MIAISGYQIKEDLYESNHSLVYRGFSEKTNQPVILKVLKKDRPSLEEVTRFQKEYALTSKLKIDGVIHAHGVEKYLNTLVIILEDFGGECLTKYLSAKKLDLPVFLSLSLRLVEILGQIHKQHIIHKDINPSNLIWNPESDQFKIIDFGISTELSQEIPMPLNPNALEGTLPYLSPEQTGRMNRGIDYRSDYYSLGVTFYQMLTGQLPFSGTDPTELVHHHIAKTPTPPHEIDPSIPLPLSQIILKLMSKTAEGRYQSSLGIQTDLEKCLKQIKGAGTIAQFKLGEEDLLDRFQISEKLYGREEEVESLLKIFDEASCNQAQIAFVLGYSGVGKSSLVRELYQPIVKKKGYFIEGKFDQFQRNIPYSALTQAFRGLMEQILSESSHRLEFWKQSLQIAFGERGQLLIELIPEIEQIIGKQPKMEELNPIETQNRFFKIFCDFVKVFALKRHPLVLFLDDLQWVDPSTLALMKNLMSQQDIHYLLFLGSYRSNEVPEGHPLNTWVEELKNQREIYQLLLAPLGKETVNQMIADTLYSEPLSTKDLAEILFQKTGGNPFFLNNVLQSLHREKIIYFSSESKSWNWNLKLLRKIEVSDNVVDFMIQRLKKFPQETQDILQLASCIGNHFALKPLAIVSQQSLKQTAVILWEMIKEGILIPQSEYCNLARIQEDSGQSNDFGASYQFQHDRIQQAAYGLMEKSHRAETHLSIGWHLLEKTSPEKQEEQIIEIVRQLNEGRDLLETKKEKEKLAALNLKAGKKAKHSCAYQPAFEYLTIGVELLAQDSWETQYELTFELMKNLAECADCCGKFDQMQEQIQILLNHAKNNLEKAEIYYFQLSQYNSNSKVEKAILTGTLALSLLGVKFSQKVNLALVIKEFLLVKWNLRNRKTSDLVNGSVINDPQKKMIIKILNEMAISIYMSGNEKLFALVCLKLVNLSLRHGLTPEAATIYGNYGIVLSGIFKKWKAGLEFGELALKLNEKFPSATVRADILISYGFFLSHWSHPWKTRSCFHKQAVEFGFQSGNFKFIGMAIISLFQDTILSPNLKTTSKAEEQYLATIEGIQGWEAWHLVHIFHGFHLNLLGLTKSRFSLSHSSFEESSTLDNFGKSKSLLGLSFYHLFKSMIYFSYEDYQNALFHGYEVDRLIEGLMGTRYLVIHCLYLSLILSALLPKMNNKEKKQARKRLKKEYKKMKKWSDHYSENIWHMKLLIEAEIANDKGERQAAADLYDQAIQAAQRVDFPCDIAIANEQTAKFYRFHEKKNISDLYLREAHYCYQQWGATAKIKFLEERYPQLLLISSTSQKLDRPFTTFDAVTTDNTSHTTTRKGDFGVLDFPSVTKSSQTISDEIVLKTLLEKMMSLILENAGAHKGFLLIEKEGDFWIEAEAFVDQVENTSQNITVLQAILVEEKKEMLPTAIIHYVARTQKMLVLEDSSQDNRFAQDPYILKKFPRSVLCNPILYQGELMGIVYLENNQATGIFTENHLKALEVLCSQAAISMSHANIYGNLEDKIEERTRQLNENLQVFKKTQSQFAHSEKMASLGSLVAGAALGINNPANLTYIGAKLINKKLKDLESFFDTSTGKNHPEGGKYLVVLFEDTGGEILENEKKQKPEYDQKQT